MTDAQKLVAEYRDTIAAAGSTANAWRWAQRVTHGLQSIGQSTIGSQHGNRAIEVFRCADGSRFAYDRAGACAIWAMPQ